MKGQAAGSADAARVNQAAEVDGRRLDLPAPDQHADRPEEDRHEDGCEEEPEDLQEDGVAHEEGDEDHAEEHHPVLLRDAREPPGEEEAAPERRGADVEGEPAARDAQVLAAGGRKPALRPLDAREGDVGNAPLRERGFHGGVEGHGGGVEVLDERLAERGVRMSLDKMFETLGTIREIHTLTSSGRGRPRIHRGTSRLDDQARQVYAALDLGRYLK